MSRCSNGRSKRSQNRVAIYVFYMRSTIYYITCTDIRKKYRSKFYVAKHLDMYEHYHQWHDQQKWLWVPVPCPIHHLTVERTYASTFGVVFSNYNDYPYLTIILKLRLRFSSLHCLGYLLHVRNGSDRTTLIMKPVVTVWLKWSTIGNTKHRQFCLNTQPNYKRWSMVL